MTFDEYQEFLAIEFPKAVKEGIHTAGKFMGFVACSPKFEPSVRRLKETMRGWSTTILDEMKKLPRELKRPFENGELEEDAKIEILLTFSAPDLKPFEKEASRLRCKEKWGF